MSMRNIGADDGDIGFEEEETTANDGPKYTAEYLHDFWQSSSLQGLPKVFTATVRFWKIFWCVLFLLLVAGCIYQMWSIFINYYAYETTTSIGLGYNHLALPSITFCNVNPVRHSQLMEHSDDYIREEYEAMVEGNQSEGYDRPVYSNRYSQTFSLLSFLDTVEPEEQLEMGHQLNPMLQSCMLYNQDCGYENFTQSLSPEFGNCYTFNSATDKNRTEPVMISHTGVFYGGVDLVLFAEEKEYLEGFNYARGFRLDIHPYNTLCQVEQHPIAIGTGQETFIKIKMVNISRLEPPYGGCSQEYAASFKELYGYDYNVESCNATCRDYKIATDCGCMYKKSAKYYTKDQQSLPVCEYGEADDCGSEIWFTGGNCTCPLPCNEIKYTIQVSSNPWGTATAYNAIVNQLCRLEDNSTSPDSNCAYLKSAREWERPEMLRNNFARVNIYFDELLYDILTENPTYDWSQFMADFGGNLGLWIGASIVTVLEIVELFTKICVSKIQRTDNGRCRTARKSLFKDSRRRKRSKKSEVSGNQVELPLKEKEALA